MSARAKYAVESAQPMRLFNALTARGVTISDISTIDKETLFVVEKKHVLKLLEVSKQLCYTIRIYEPIGVSKYVKFFLGRLGLVVAFALTVTFVGWRWSLISSIKIIGDDAHSLELTETLNQLGVKEGIFKSKIDLNDLSDTLSKIDGISRVQVYFSGVNLILNVRDSVLGDASVELAQGTTISANADCKITKLTVIAGTPKVKVGDIVTKGQVIVEGFEGEGKERHEVAPRAVVYGEVWYTAVHDFYPIREVVQQTGNMLVQRILSLGRHTFGSLKSNPFCESETAIHKQNILTFLPLQMTTTTYFETTKVTEQFDFDKEREKLELLTLERARAKVTLDCSVIDEFNIITKELTYTRVRGVITASKIVS